MLIPRSTPTPIAAAAAGATDPGRSLVLPPRRELAGKHGVQRRAELAVELLGLELGVDGLGLVLARLRTLRVGARSPVRSTIALNALSSSTRSRSAAKTSVIQTSAPLFDAATQNVQRGAASASAGRPIAIATSAIDWRMTLSTLA